VSVMTTVRIKDLLERTPFKPFSINLDSGRTVRVTHPDCVWFTPSKRTAIVAERDRSKERLRIIDLAHIADLES
jgi:hypothetical protein